MNKKNKILLYLLPIFATIFLFLPIFVSTSPKHIKSSEVTNWYKLDDISKEMKYTDFMNHVYNGDIDTVYAEFGSEEYQKTLYVLLDDKLYEVQNPNNDSFKKELLDNGLEIKDKSEVFEQVGLTARNSSSGISLSDLLSLGIFIVFIIMMLDMLPKSNPLNAFNNDTSIYKQNTKDNTDSAENSKKTFDDVGGLTELKKDLRCVVDFLTNSEKYKKAGAKIPRGILLEGTPGTGKTLLAKAVANEAKVPFISISGSQFVEVFAGRGAARVRELFKEARKQAPCIIFIDEIDALAKQRSSGLSSGHEEREQTLNQLLTEMDGFKSSDGIIVMAATNRADVLDQAILRPGRFSEIYTVPVPETHSERLEVINIYAKDKKFDETVNLDDFSKEMIGRSPAEIEDVLNEAAIISVQKGLKYINKQCLEIAFFKRVMHGHMKDNNETNPKDLKTVAYHEAGHALIGKLFGQEVTKVTIIPSTSGAGGVTFIQPGEEKLYSKKKMKERIMGLYGGRVAEYLLFNEDWEEITTGASNDIEQATKLLYAMVDIYGMSDNSLVNMNILKGEGISEKSTEYIVKLSEELKNETVRIMKENRVLLDKLAEALLEKETLYEKEIDEILGIEHVEKVSEQVIDITKRQETEEIKTKEK